MSYIKSYLLQSWSIITNKPAHPVTTFTGRAPANGGSHMNTCCIDDADGDITGTSIIKGEQVTETYSTYPADFDADDNTYITITGQISSVKIGDIGLKSGNFTELNFSTPNTLKNIYISNNSGYTYLKIIELGGCAELTDLTIMNCHAVETLLFDGCPKLKRLTVASLAALNVGNVEAEVMAETLPETTDGVLTHAECRPDYPDNYFEQFAAVARRKGWTVVELNTEPDYSDNEPESK